MTLATDLDRLAVDTIRTLSIDGVQKANSGHPGAPMGAAPDGVRRSGPASSVTPRLTRTGPTATGSC